jgi:hypothetical protein
VPHCPCEKANCRSDADQFDPQIAGHCLGLGETHRGNCLIARAGGDLHGLHRGDVDLLRSRDPIGQQFGKFVGDIWCRWDRSRAKQAIGLTPVQLVSDVVAREIVFSNRAFGWPAAMRSRCEASRAAMARAKFSRAGSVSVVAHSTASGNGCNWPRVIVLAK